MLDLASTPYVYIVLVNWNGWQDTIECLESVFRLNYPRFTVVVCDNASTDGSLEKIESWAAGHIEARCSSPSLLSLVSPPVQKPVSSQSFASPHQFHAAAAPSPIASSSTAPPARLILIQTGSNLGFAGGNNVGIRYALSQPRCDYVWLLNNDTVVEPGALTAMIAMTQPDPRLGICGSLLRSYFEPAEIQSAGRTYNRWTGRTHLIRGFPVPPLSTQPGAAAYVEGASMLVRRRFLEEIGLMEEGYFLFFEELDWAARAKPAFHLGFAAESVVYHKGGSATGGALERARRSASSDFYRARNSIVLTRRYYPICLPTVVLSVALAAIHRLLIGKSANAAALLRGVWASFRPAQSQGPLSR